MPGEKTKDNRLAIEPSVALASANGERMRAFKKLEQVINDGLRHGFFEYTVVCEVINGQKRQLVIKAGVSHKFTIPMEEIANLS